jgi:hypothetical protein
MEVGDGWMENLCHAGFWLMHEFFPYPDSNCHLSSCDGKHSRSNPGSLILLGPGAHLDLGHFTQGSIWFNLEKQGSGLKETDNKFRRF